MLAQAFVPSIDSSSCPFIDFPWLDPSHPKPVGPPPTPNLFSESFFIPPKTSTSYTRQISGHSTDLSTIQFDPRANLNFQKEWELRTDMARHNTVLQHSNVPDGTAAAMTSILVTALSPVSSIWTSSILSQRHPNVSTSQNPRVPDPRGPNDYDIEMMPMSRSRLASSTRGTPSQTDGTSTPTLVDEPMEEAAKFPDEARHRRRRRWYVRPDFTGLAG